MILHTVNKPGDCLDRCLALASPGDVILLIEDGVYASIDSEQNRSAWSHAPETLQCFALAPDLAARGITDTRLSRFETADWQDFVALSVSCDKVISWG